MEMAASGQYLFRDQDILNAHFKDSYLPLPARMNVFNTKAIGYNRVPLEGHRQAMAAKRNPLVIHYAAGDYKPWKVAPVPYAEHYWSALIRTPFYAEVVAGLMPAATPRRKTLQRRLRSSGQAVLARAPGLRPAVYKVLRTVPGLRGLVRG
jgi:Lipopolysaccharide biosynthesis proteins, LPS:glycosyltransferases